MTMVVSTRPPDQTSARPATPSSWAGDFGPAESSELVELREQLREALETIEAIREGGVDSLVIGPSGQERVYSLTGADQLYRLLVDAMNEGAATISASGVILHANPCLAAMVGRPSTTLAGMDAVELASGKHRSALRRLLRVESGGQSKGELEIGTATGTRTPVRVSVSAFDFDATAVRCVVFTDLTDHRASERGLTRMLGALRESESSLRAANRALQMVTAVNRLPIRIDDEASLMAESCHVAIGVGGYKLAWVGLARDLPDKPIEPVASAGEPLEYIAGVRLSWGTGARGRGPTGRAVRLGTPQVARFIATDPAMAPWRTAAIAAGFASSAAVPLAAEGRVIGALTVYSTRPDAFAARELDLLAAMGKDLGQAIDYLRARADRERAEDEVVALNAQLEQRVRERTAALEAANRELEAFSYSVSHDLRAPLRSIDGFSKILLADHAAQLDPEARRVLDVVARNARQMGTLIDDLLAFSRVMRRDVERKPVDMGSLARGALNALRAAEPDRDLGVDIGPLDAVDGDPVLLGQVWANLLGNAVKFTRKVERARIAVASERVGGEVRFTVADNGVGFDATYVDKLFQPFSRLHAASEFEGSGIGLAIVARIVQRHRGRVWAESTPGAGATFGFALPGEPP